MAKEAVAVSSIAWIPTERSGTRKTAKIQPQILALGSAFELSFTSARSLARRVREPPAIAKVSHVNDALSDGYFNAHGMVAALVVDGGGCC